MTSLNFVNTQQTKKRLCIPPVGSYMLIVYIQQFVRVGTHTQISTKRTEMEINTKPLLKISNGFVCFAVDSEATLEMRF